MRKSDNHLVILTLIFGATALHGPNSWGQDVTTDQAPADRQTLVQGIAPGAEVRLQTLSRAGSGEAETLSGSFKSCQDGVMTLVISVIPEQLVRVPVSDLASVEVKTGGRSFIFEGILLGLGSGYLVASSMEPDGTLYGPGPKIAGVVTLGAVVGLILGSVVSSDTWSPVFDESVELSWGVGVRGHSEVAFGFSF